MKPLIKIFLLSCTLFLLTNCGKQSNDNGEEAQVELAIDQVVNKANVACNSPAPQQSLGWLGDIIKKAEEDRLTKKHMNQYIGRIFLTSYKSQPVFYIIMGMGSGGLARYVYDCAGSSVTISDSDFFAFEQQAPKGTLIYSNMP
jgi:hypothetical protein